MAQPSVAPASTSAFLLPCHSIIPPVPEMTIMAWWTGKMLFKPDPWYNFFMILIAKAERDAGHRTKGKTDVS